MDRSDMANVIRQVLHVLLWVLCVVDQMCVGSFGYKFGYEVEQRPKCSVRCVVTHSLSVFYDVWCVLIGRSGSHMCCAKGIVVLKHEARDGSNCDM